MRALNPAEKDLQRITDLLKKQSEKPKLGDMKFSVKLKEIDKFEKLNSQISVNVFGFEENVYL